MRIAVRAPAPGAVKIGMVPGPAVAEALVRGLEGYAGPVVVDPVLAASSGGALWQGPLEALWPILRRATLVTPNAPEAAALSGRPVETLDDARAAAAALRAAGIAAVLVKGGHLGETADGTITDVLVTAEGERLFTRQRERRAEPARHRLRAVDGDRRRAGGGATAASRQSSARPTGWRCASRARSSATARGA